MTSRTTSRPTFTVRANGTRREPLLIRSRVAGLGGQLDRVLTEMLRPVTLPALRVLLGMLFAWFGALKVLGRSPVGEMVSGTLPWADPRLTVLVLGAVEVVLGMGLITGFAVRLVLPLLAAHLSGTFLTFVMLPQLMFRGHNPLLLTESGEFVTKNLILIAATLVLIAHTGTRATSPSGTGAHPAPEQSSAPRPAGAIGESITEPIG
jgi:putative oxidoreductase